MTDSYEDQEQKAAIAERDRLLLALQLEDDFTGIMTTAPGRRFIWAMLNEFGAFNHLFDECHAVMAYREGRRAAGLYLLDYINKTCPHLYAVMAQENTIKSEG